MFALKTPDPKFNPHEEITVNGFRFVPVGNAHRLAADYINTQNRIYGRVDSAVENMGEALARLGGRLKESDFIHSDSNPITDANAAAYEAVGKAWDKLTAEIARINPEAHVVLTNGR